MSPAFDSDSGADRDGPPPLRKIIHVDMDAFYASVEQRDDPSLRGRPVIVGGRPNGRGVVAACSYEARVFGIHSAMPSAEAGRRCPEAAFVSPRFAVYKEVCAQIRAVFAEFSEKVEPLSLDEAYLDVTDSTLLGGSAVRMAREIKTLIRERTDLVASAGVSYNKFLAKIASDHRKPDGLFWVLPADGEAFVASLPIGRFHGIGRVTEARMQALGIETGADLRQWPLEELAREFGKSAGYYFRIARGIDERPVQPSRTRKSMGSERTFAENLLDRDAMLSFLSTLLDEVLSSLDDHSLAGRTLVIKVRFTDFQTLTRGWSQPGRPIDARAAHRALPFLLDRALQARADSGLPGRGGRSALAVRLLGVSLGSLVPSDERRPEQLELEVADATPPAAPAADGPDRNAASAQPSITSGNVVAGIGRHRK